VGTVPEVELQPDDASRVTTERQDAERRYREALEAVDRTIPSIEPPRAAADRGDARGADALAPLWEVMQEPPAPSLVGRLLALIRKLIRLPLAGVLRRQQRFNQAVTTHAASADATAADLRAQMQALGRFHHHLIQYMQRIWPLVDTSYRHQMVVGSGMAAHIQEANAVQAMRWEVTQTRDRRLAAALAAATDELRASLADQIETLANVNQTSATLKRELERLLAAVPSPGGQAGPMVPAGSAAGEHAEPVGSRVRSAAHPDAVNAYKYVGFEHKFRGPESLISERIAGYLPLFDGASDVLDLGCGRGEFLAALRDRGVGARGLDINHEMVELCRSRGLAVDEADALTCLEGLPDRSLGGLFAAQVVEHFQPGYLMRLLDVAFHALRPGSRIVLETLNPACWSAFFDSYIRDVTHVWPLHPDTLSFLVTTAGFHHVEVRYLSPYPPEYKLQPMAVSRDATLTPAEVAMMETFNANVDRLNGHLFSNRDYAVIAERL